MFNKSSIAGAAAAACLLLAAQSAGAAEGVFKGVGIGTHDYDTLKHHQQTIVAGSIDGVLTVLDGAGEPFRVGDVFMLRCVVYAEQRAESSELQAPCTWTDEAGDVIYTHSTRRAGDVATSSAADGTWELLGGTGRFANVSGTCPYSTQYLPNGYLIFRSECDWRQ